MGNADGEMAWGVLSHSTEHPAHPTLGSCSTRWEESLHTLHLIRAHITQAPTVNIGPSAVRKMQ